MTNQTMRCIQAGSAIVAICLCIAVAETVIHRYQWGDFYGQQSQGSLGLSHLALETNLSTMPEELFARVSGATAPSRDIPSDFETEIMRTPSNVLHVAAGEAVVGYVLSEDVAHTKVVVFSGLEHNGWHCVSDDELTSYDGSAPVQHYAFWKERGHYRWVYLALYALADTTTCVFTYSEEKGLL